MFLLRYVTIEQSKGKYLMIKQSLNRTNRTEYSEFIFYIPSPLTSVQNDTTHSWTLHLMCIGYVYLNILNGSDRVQSVGCWPYDSNVVLAEQSCHVISCLSRQNVSLQLEYFPSLCNIWVANKTNKNKTKWKWIWRTKICGEK